MAQSVVGEIIVLANLAMEHIKIKLHLHWLQILEEMQLKLPQVDYIPVLSLMMVQSVVGEVTLLDNSVMVLEQRGMFLHKLIV